MFALRLLCPAKAATGFVSHELCMCHDFVACPISHAVQATLPWTRALATAGGTLHHCANLSVSLFAVHSNVCAALFCSQPPSWLVLSHSHAAQVCAALLSAGDITTTTARTWRSRFATAQGAWSDTLSCVLVPVIRHARPPWRPELTRVRRRCVFVCVCVRLWLGECLHGGMVVARVGCERWPW